MTRFTYGAYRGINMEKRTIDKEIIKDISRGMPGSELAKKYNLSESQLQSIFHQVAELRERRIQMLVSDLRSGMVRSELMKKYQLSPEGLESALKPLLEAEAISSVEFEAFSTFREEYRTGGDSRGTLRDHPIQVVKIYEAGKPETKYLVRDISENGIGITDMRGQIDEIKSFVVVGYESGEIAPFEFEAQCRWVKRVEPDEVICSGFRITKIGEQDLLRLRELIQGELSSERPVVKVPKVKVEAKEVLTDIRSGMTDAELMEKYGLSARGLKSLFNKLVLSGFMHWLDAREVLEDLRSGMSDAELMSKHLLSEKALHNLFAEMDRAHLLKEAARPEDKPDEIESESHEIAADVGSGVRNAELTLEYQLMEPGLGEITTASAQDREAAGTYGSQSLGLELVERPPGMPDAENGPPTEILEVDTKSHQIRSHGSLREAPEIERKGTGFNAFVIGGAVLWFLGNVVYFAYLASLENSSDVGAYAVFLGIWSMIALLAGGLYFLFRRWIQTE
jgi:uncharacterized protein (DUF433 family)